MTIERRALNAEEREVLNAFEPGSLFLKEVLLFAALGGAVVGVILAFAIGLILKLAGLQTGNMENLPLILGVFGALALGAHGLWDVFQSRKQSAERRATLLQSEDLIVETHHVQEVKLVREPEHGQPMYFVRTDEDLVHFVLEGQNTLDEKWETEPLSLSEEEAPRRGLKLIRDPANKECIMESFFGDAFAPDKCFEIGLDPQYWPASGKKIKAPWDELDRRYRLKEMPFENS